MEHVETTWRQMNTHGQTWKITDRQGHAWSCGHKKIYPDTHRDTLIFTRKHMVINRSTWTYTDKDMDTQGWQNRVFNRETQLMDTQ